MSQQSKIRRVNGYKTRKRVRKEHKHTANIMAIQVHNDNDLAERIHRVRLGLIAVKPRRSRWWHLLKYFIKLKCQALGRAVREARL